MKPGLEAQVRAWRERLRALKNLPPVVALLWNSGRALVGHRSHSAHHFRA